MGCSPHLSLFEKSGVGVRPFSGAAVRAFRAHSQNPRHTAFQRAAPGDGRTPTKTVAALKVIFEQALRFSWMQARSNVSKPMARASRPLAP
jgi:hypothetical protein